MQQKQTHGHKKQTNLSKAQEGMNYEFGISRYILVYIK